MPRDSRRAPLSALAERCVHLPLTRAIFSCLMSLLRRNYKTSVQTKIIKGVCVKQHRERVYYLAGVVFLGGESGKRSATSSEGRSSSLVSRLSSITASHLWIAGMGTETRQRVRSLASTSSNSGAFLVLMSFLRVSISFVDATETGNALVVDSPSTRQNRVSVFAMDGGAGSG